MFESRITSRRSRVVRQAVEALEDRRLLSTVFAADFETPLTPDWQIDGTPAQLWHVTTYRSQSGTHSLYYGRDAEHNYDIGTNSGTVTTPAINLAGMASPTLQFRYLLNIEALLAEDTRVQISSDPTFSTWTTLASDNPDISKGETRLINSTTNEVGWLGWSGSLAAYAGSTVKLRFYFDSWDNIQNGYEGWYVDDVIVSATDTPPSVTGVTPADSTVIGSSTNIQYTFSENVTGVDATDLTLSGPAATGASVTGVSGSGNTWTFAVSGLTAGVLTTTLAKDTGDITDSIGQSPSSVVTKYLVILPDVYDSAAANETIGTASNLGVVGGTRTFSNLTLHTDTDVDFYKFTADASGPVTLTLAYDTSVISNSIVDFYAYDNNQTQYVEPDPQDQDQTITFQVTKGQTYYVNVLADTQIANNNYTLTIDAPAEAPTVTRVWVKGSAWNANYLSFLGANIANSSATYGYAIPTGTNQLQTLPWSNLNTVSIQFSEAVNLSQTQLVMVGTSTYNVAGSTFSYNATDRVGTWRLPANFVADRLYLKLLGSGAGVVQDLAGIALDGEFTTSTSSFPSGNGIPGGDFQFRFTVLPGDVNATSTVSISDIALTESRSGQAITAANYRSDVNGSNSISISDIAFTESRSGTPLPPAPTGMTFSQSLLFSDELLLS